MHVRRTPITDRKVRFAIIGCGRIAQNHFDAISKHSSRAELVAVCDTDPAVLAGATKKTGAKGFASLTELLAGAQADCVVLTTPSGLHPRQTIEAARAGLDVMTEKPMATRWHDGLAMVRACDEAGVRLLVEGISQPRSRANEGADAPGRDLRRPQHPRPARSPRRRLRILRDRPSMIGFALTDCGGIAKRHGDLLSTGRSPARSSPPSVTCRPAASPNSVQTTTDI